jgi:hypothetical protein
VQAADCPLEFEGTVPFRVQRFRFCGCAGDQFDLCFIERVDQGDKAGGFIALVGAELCGIPRRMIVWKFAAMVR